MNGLIVLILQFALVGFIVWAIVTYIPMPQIFKNILIVVVVIFVLIWLIQKLGGSI